METADQSDVAKATDVNMSASLFALPSKKSVPSTLTSAQASGAAFYNDIAYGTDSRQSFDLLVPKNLNAAKKGQALPLVIYFHGGGFESGDKSEAYTTGKTYENLAEQMEQYLAAGFAVASANYRLLSNEGASPFERGVLRSLKDCQRMVQFVRLHQAELGIQGSKIALHGTSAGAGAALWLAVSPDQADAHATDPVLRESSLVSAVAANEVQGSYDIQQWEDVIFKPYGVKISQFLRGPLGASFLRFYGIASAAEFDSEPLKEYRQRVDLLGLMSKDSAPFRVSNQLQPLAPPTDSFALLHHVFHGQALHKQAQRVNLEHDVNLPALNILPTFASSADFLISVLK